MQRVCTRGTGNLEGHLGVLPTYWWRNRGPENLGAMCKIQQGARAAKPQCLPRGHGDLAQDKQLGRTCGGLGLLEPDRDCSVSEEVDQANSLTVLFDRPLQDSRHQPSSL